MFLILKYGKLSGKLSEFSEVGHILRSSRLKEERSWRCIPCGYISIALTRHGLGTAWAQLGGLGWSSPEIKIRAVKEVKEVKEDFFLRIPQENQSYQPNKNKVKDLWQSKLHKRKHSQSNRHPSQLDHPECLISSHKSAKSAFQDGKIILREETLEPDPLDAEICWVLWVS